MPPVHVEPHPPAPPRLTRPRPSPRALPPGLVRWAVLVAGVVGAILCWSGVVAGELPWAARASLAATSLAVGLWGSELLALPVTALLAMTLLYVLGAVERLEQAFVGFSSSVLFFLLATAGLGIAAEHTGLADRMAGWLLRRSGGSGRRLLGELLLSLPLQALLIPSAISRNAVLVPVYARVLDRLERPPRLGAGVMLGLGVLGPLASSALLSGGTSPVAAANALGGFTWLSWFVSLALPYYVLLALDALLLWVMVRPERRLAGGVGDDAALAPGGPLTAAEWRVAAVSAATAVLWVMDWLTGWPPAVPALLALLVLLLPRVGVLPWQQFAGRAPWGVAVVLAAAVSLAVALAGSGAAEWLAGLLFAALPLPRDSWAMALAIFGVTALVTLAIPNRAAAITLAIPLAVAYADTGPLPAVAAGLVVMIAVDAEALYPAQTAANLIAYERGYFGAGLLARFNLATLLMAALVVVLVALPWWSLVGLPEPR